MARRGAGRAALAIGGAASGEALAGRYLAPLGAQGAFGNTLRETLAAYFANDMRLDRTAEALFIHPNTLKHRLRRFRELTGADLRRSEQAFEVWWALRYAEQTKRQARRD